MELTKIRAVRSGTSASHVRPVIKGKSARAECAFYVTSQSGASLELEAKDPEERERWVAAFGLLWTTARKDPNSEWLRHM